MTSYTFEQIKPFLKMSKSRIEDTAPYTATCASISEDLYDIWDCDMRIVGQATGLELRCAQQK
jgi:hypothetical protein